MYRSRVNHLFYIPAMMCEWCVSTLTDILHTLDRSAHVEADLRVRILSVQTNRYEAALLRTLHESGHPAEPVLRPLG